MGCKQLQIQDYFTLRTSQKSETPCLDSTHQTPIHTAKYSQTYAYDSILEEKTIAKNDLQLLICIQNILKMLFLFCDLRTNTPTFTLTTYTYDALQDDFTTKNRKNDTSIRRKNAPSNSSPTTITNNDLKATATKGSYNKNTSASKYDYNNDALGRRTSMGKSGTAFDINGTPSPDTISYLYNDRSEVTSASSANDSTYDFGYNFDQIGNREDYTTNETGTQSVSNYTTNTLNQYTQIARTGETSFAPSYDDDGNMLTLKLESGDWSNTYNAENRIIIAEKSDEKLEMVYDYMGRRISKKVYSGSTDNWSLVTDNCFVYDNYVQIEELGADNSNAILNKRIWSGGKIICDIRNDVAYYALGDANKNITEYVDTSGAIQAHYEYSPFGKITVQNGAMEDYFDFRFSSEVLDTETGLVYYNYRYYSPELGRWLCRDRIEQKNPYLYVSNHIINTWDYLGLLEYPETTKLTKAFIGSSPWDLAASDITKQYDVFVYQGAREEFKHECGKCYCVAQLNFIKGLKMIGKKSRYNVFADIIAKHDEEFKSSKIIDIIAGYLVGKIPVGSELVAIKDIIEASTSKIKDVKIKVGHVYNREKEYAEKEGYIINSKQYDEMNRYFFIPYKYREVDSEDDCDGNYEDTKYDDLGELTQDDFNKLNKKISSWPECE